MEFSLSLIIPSFIAGVITFLAPCTLPLVPGYISFISGLSIEGLKDHDRLSRARSKIMLNGLLYVIGFSAVFILLGSLVGLGGRTFVQYRPLLSRVGGVFVILFGLYIMNAFSLLRKVLPDTDFSVLDKLGQDYRFHVTEKLEPGKPSSSLIFGATFAFGWTPCVGPVLGSILFLASTSGTVGQGALLLGVFSLGLALPFLALAFTVGSALTYLKSFSRYLHLIEIFGGLFLILLGIFMITNSLAVWVSWMYKTFSFLNLEERLLDYL